MERTRHPELDPTLLDAFTTTFVLRRDAYPWQQPDGAYIAVRRPLTTPLLLGHLNGHITLGTYALNQENMAKWVCLDADTEAQKTVLWEMANTLEDAGIPLYRERSRRGFHLWLFFQQPLTGLLTRRFAHQLLFEHGIDPDEAGQKPLEIYPRQIQLVEDGLGSLVRLPLGVHRKTGKIYPFVDRHDQPLAPTPRQLLPIIATPDRVPLSYIMGILSRSQSIEVAQPTPAFVVRRSKHSKDTLPSQRILEAISTRDFVSQYVELDAHNKGYCPFHDDEHKSFNVVENGNYWNCFAGCGGGNLIHFWSRWRSEHGADGSFVETVKDLLHLLKL